MPRQVWLRISDDEGVYAEVEVSDELDEEEFVGALMKAGKGES